MFWKIFKVWLTMMCIALIAYWQGWNILGLGASILAQIVAGAMWHVRPKKNQE